MMKKYMDARFLRCTSKLWFTIAFKWAIHGGFCLLRNRMEFKCHRAGGV